MLAIVQSLYYRISGKISSIIFPFISINSHIPQTCLRKNDCSCIKELELVPASCPNFKDMERKIRAAKRKCLNNKVAGSFSDCRAQERKVAYYAQKCKTPCTGPFTTKVAKIRLQKISREALLIHRKTC